MRKGIPNLGALQAFEATARLGSFSRAAEELALTHSAVYRQVDGLEQRLGVALFKRVRRRISLTDAGAEYAGRVRHHLEQLEKDTFGLMTRAGLGHNLHIAVLPTLANHWLLPRMPEFQRLHPEIVISMSVQTLAFQFTDNPLDAAIYHANQAWTQTKGFKLFDEKALIPVCTPQLFDEHQAKNQDFNINQMPHLHISSRPDAWHDWYKNQGLEYPAKAHAGPRYELFSMHLAAAQAGMGLALLPKFLVQDLLANKSLISPSNAYLPVNEAYYFGYPNDREPNPALLDFEKWLRKLVS